MSWLGTKTVSVPRQKCRKMATHAHKLSDFWVSTCDEHTHSEASISINKAIDAFDFPKKQKKRA
jgi:hypothetical protein